MIFQTSLQPEQYTTTNILYNLGQKHKVKIMNFLLLWKTEIENELCIKVQVKLTQVLRVCNRKVKAFTGQILLQYFYSINMQAILLYFYFPLVAEILVKLYIL